MSSGVEIVNAALTVITSASAESRAQPLNLNVQKRRWGNRWSHYWCFGSYKKGKRIGHAVLVPESTITRIPSSSSSSVTNNNSSQPPIIVLPFVAPPSSPALQSDPPSATLSPARSHHLTSVDSLSPGGIASGFTIGPYAHETQLVSPPVFSAYNTEPSTASVTPPAELNQSSSSPEVPFSQLLSSELARQKDEANLSFTLSQYDYQPYQSFTSCPGSRIISPGSTGTSSPFVGKDQKQPLSYDHFTRKWGSSRTIGSSSGTLTPNNNGGISILGFGDCYLPENEISEVESENEENIVDHRLSFELTGVPNHDKIIDSVTIKETVLLLDIPISNKDSIMKTLKQISSFEEGVCIEKRQSISLGSSKDFNFDNTKQESLDKSMIDCEWWTNDNNVEEEIIKELGSDKKNWTFFPMLHHGVN